MREVDHSGKTLPNGFLVYILTNVKKQWIKPSIVTCTDSHFDPEFAQL